MKNGWWSIYYWIDVCVFVVCRCFVLIMNNLMFLRLIHFFSLMILIFFFFLVKSIYNIYDLIVFYLHLLLIRNLDGFFSCGHFRKNNNNKVLTGFFSLFFWVNLQLMQSLGNFHRMHLAFCLKFFFFRGTALKKAVCSWCVFFLLAII